MVNTSHRYGRAISPYYAVKDDEISLSLNDSLKVSILFQDGWCFGSNLSQNSEGVFPKDCVDFGILNSAELPVSKSIGTTPTAMLDSKEYDINMDNQSDLAQVFQSAKVFNGMSTQKKALIALSCILAIIIIIVISM